tara:strand:+ start:473 stop:1618 length:1146 start_codon:yes stop_codon:yes gene_type:complete
MDKIYTAMGLMSGTSLDGIDVSIIKSDGNREYLSVFDRFFEYEGNLIKKILKMRDKISNSESLDRYLSELKALEREITLFNFKAVNETLKISKSSIDLIGFHGQTIFHDPQKKITKQLGDGKLLSQLTKKKVVYNFRQKDLENGGQGAPLVPIFHNSIANKLNKKFDLKFPINILNIGGIANITTATDWDNLWHIKKIHAFDIGPGNCLIDEWIRKNSKARYDKEGLVARSGKTDQLILNQALENFNINSHYDKSLDTNDFDIFFAKGLSLENGAATITNFTAKLIADGMNYAHTIINSEINNWLVCGGGRKNKYLLEKIKSNFEQINIDLIDKYEIDGDFVESQAFAFLAIRSLEGMHISFPSTTGCKEPSIGGIVVENF